LELPYFWPGLPNPFIQRNPKLRKKSSRRPSCFEKSERYIININDPKYYATFLTNKGPKKRYVRYGKFRFSYEGKEHSLELYKSILGDTIFIPFYDKTNGEETYEGGRYLDAEILMPGYRVVVDFNYAYNPSCVYNETLVCVLPLEENRLKIEIPSGEKKFK
jgi:uncharacterized protein (DUF1684 family)